MEARKNTIFSLENYFVSKVTSKSASVKSAPQRSVNMSRVTGLTTIGAMTS